MEEMEEEVLLEDEMQKYDIKADHTYWKETEWQVRDMKALHRK